MLSDISVISDQVKKTCFNALFHKVQMLEKGI